MSRYYLTLIITESSFFFLVNLLDTDHLVITITWLHQYYSVRLECIPVVFRIVVISRSLYSVFLELSRDECYLYLICLGLPGSCESLKNSVDSTSCHNRQLDKVYRIIYSLQSLRNPKLYCSQLLGIQLISRKSQENRMKFPRGNSYSKYSGVHKTNGPLIKYQIKCLLT